MEKLPSYYYRIDNPELLAKIDAFFERVRAFDAQVKTLCEANGVEHYRSFNSVMSGIEFLYLLAKSDQQVDETKFKVGKPKGGYKVIQPRKGNKEFYAEFKRMVPESIDYKVLTALIVKSWGNGMPSLGYRHRAGEFFYFTTKGVPVDEAVEVVASEYHGAHGGDDEDPEQST